MSFPVGSYVEVIKDGNDGTYAGEVYQVTAIDYEWMTSDISVPFNFSVEDFTRPKIKKTDKSRLMGKFIQSMTGMTNKAIGFDSSMAILKKNVKVWEPYATEVGQELLKGVSLE